MNHKTIKVIGISLLSLSGLPLVANLCPVCGLKAHKLNTCPYGDAIYHLKYTSDFYKNRGRSNFQILQWAIWSAYPEYTIGKKSSLHVILKDFQIYILKSLPLDENIPPNVISEYGQDLTEREKQNLWDLLCSRIAKSVWALDQNNDNSYDLTFRGSKKLLRPIGQSENNHKFIPQKNPPQIDININPVTYSEGEDQRSIVRMQQWVKDFNACKRNGFALIIENGLAALMQEK